MKKIISKKELDELKKIKGEVRGMGMKTHADYILNMEGEEGLVKLENVLAELGEPIKYKELRKMNFYPLWREALTLVAIQRVFSYKDEDFKELGRFHSKLSLIFRLFLKRFFSFGKIAKEIPKVWNKYFTHPGEFEVVEFSEENRRAVFRLKNFSFHPLHCLVRMGILEGLTKIVAGTAGTCVETRCTYRGDAYHEYQLKW